MFDRVGTGWQLAKQSWQVLKLDKELLLFPLLSGIACLVVMASFVVPLWTSGYFDMMSQNQAATEKGAGQVQQIIGYVVLFAFYLVNYFVIIFFNSALIACAIIRFKGGNPSLSDGFSAAFARLPQIAGWACVSATVGLILRIIESRSEKVGAIIAGLLGMAWSALTYFVVPVVVVEKLGPIKAGQRSLEILKRTWGEALSANFGIGFITFLFSLVCFIPLVLGGFAIGAGLVSVGVACIIIGVLALLIVALISSALDAIIIGALYLYAAEGTVPERFDDAVFRSAFAHK